MWLEIKQQQPLTKQCLFLLQLTSRVLFKLLTYILPFLLVASLVFGWPPYRSDALILETSKVYMGMRLDLFC